MFEYLYEWLVNLSFYLILVTAITHIIPGNMYKKYIRFFTGLVLISMLIMPVHKIFGGEVQISEIYDKFYDKIEKKFAENIVLKSGDYKSKDVEKENSEIEVEEILIGP